MKTQEIIDLLRECRKQYVRGLRVANDEEKFFAFTQKREGLATNDAIDVAINGLELERKDGPEVDQAQVEWIKRHASRIGIYEKYRVSRADGTDKPGLKHHDCDLFVLDITHDPFAQEAAVAYAMACRDKFPALANDLLRMVGKHILSEQENRE